MPVFYRDARALQGVYHGFYKFFSCAVSNTNGGFGHEHEKPTGVGETLIRMHEAATQAARVEAHVEEDDWSEPTTKAVLAEAMGCDPRTAYSTLVGDGAIKKVPGGRHDKFSVNYSKVRAWRDAIESAIQKSKAKSRRKLRNN